MSGPIKKVYVTCHEPIAVCRQAQQSWSACYLRFSRGRKTIYKGPTLLSRPALEMDLQCELILQAANPDIDLSEEIQELKRAISGNGITCENINAPCPNIYTDNEYIDRAEAELMIAALLGEYGITKFKQKWKHPGNCIVHPVNI